MDIEMNHTRAYILPPIVNEWVEVREGEGEEKLMPIHIEAVRDF